MKALWSSLAVVVLMAVNTANANTNFLNEAPNFKYDAQVVKQRLERMESIVDVRFTQEVENYIRAYLTFGKTSTEIMLGYAKVYFPAIEYNIHLSSLPEDLKYLSVVESNLRPYAVSVSGAAGLWQLMPYTGQIYGLVQNKWVDERRDPYRSTQVALKYLSQLHDEFGSWELAFAAYNCGPGRLNQIIKEVGSRDFWVLQPHLPKETASYIPKFIAASYVLKYAFLHGLVPQMRDPEMLNTSAVAVFDRMEFSEIEDITNTKYSLIRKLNSMYFQGVVPESDYGHLVTLPQKSASKLSAFVNKKCNAAQSEGIVRIFTYTIKPGDNLSAIAHRYNCSVADLKSWNGIIGEKILLVKKLP